LYHVHNPTSGKFGWGFELKTSLKKEKGKKAKTLSVTQNHKIVYKNGEINFKVIKTKRRKTSEIVIKFNEVLIRTPFSKSRKDIDSMVKNKAEWILEKLKENNGKKPEIALPEFKDNTTLPYLGQNCILKVVRDGKSDFLEFSNGVFIVHVKKNSVKTTYEKWLFVMAPAIFDLFIEKYCVLLNVRPKKILIKKLKSRWGSATFKGTINLNVNLVKAPISVIEYVVLHEIGHLVEKNHSPKFWKLIRDHMFDYSEKKDWLKINGMNIS
jgi:predicted metal-dependent hydrolase